jgi:hypothetical protein
LDKEPYLEIRQQSGLGLPHKGSDFDVDELAPILEIDIEPVPGRKGRGIEIEGFEPRQRVFDKVQPHRDRAVELDRVQKTVMIALVMLASAGMGARPPYPSRGKSRKALYSGRWVSAKSIPK